MQRSTAMAAEILTIQQQFISPQQVGSPDNGQVLAVHVGDVAERGQMGKVSHEELQRPRNKIFIYSALIGFCCNLADAAPQCGTQSPERVL